MKGKILAIGTLLVLSVLLLIQTSVAYASVNLLQNPGFETGGFDPWQHDAITGYVDITSLGHTGSYKVTMSAEGAAWISQDIAPPRHAEYLEFWYKGLGGNIWIGYSDGTSHEENLPTTDTWTLAHISLDTNKLVNKVVVHVYSAVGIDVDDFYLKSLVDLVVPEVPLGTVVATVTMVAAFGAYCGFKKQKQYIPHF